MGLFRRKANPAPMGYCPVDGKALIHRPEHDPCGPLVSYSTKTGRRSETHYETWACPDWDGISRPDVGTGPHVSRDRFLNL